MTAIDLELVVTLVVLALASARLTRLIVRDKFTAPIPEFFQHRLHTRADRLLNQVDSPSGGGWHIGHRHRRSVRRARRADAVARWFDELTSCGWCTSVWTSISLVVAWWAWTPSTWLPLVVYSLAAAEVAGQVRRRD